MKNTNKRRCFIDFDGTLVDNKYRIYQFFIDNIPGSYSKVLSIDEFWALKRLGVNEIDWLNMKFDANISLSEWNVLKKNNIESEKYLIKDVLFEYSKEILLKIKEKYELILITRRDNRIGLLGELKRFQLIDMFDNILVIPHNQYSKAEYIKKLYEPSENDILVGDTEDDIVAGIDLGIKTYLVLSGIRGRWIIYNLNLQDKVDVIINLSELEYLA